MSLTETPATLRIDKWLWHARFFKTRSLAAKVVAGGHVRRNAARVTKSSQGVGVGDTLTFSQGRDVRVVRVVALGVRRGPAPEARALYEDLSPEPTAPAPDAPRKIPGGRPTGKQRRSFDQSRQRWLDS